MRVDDLFSSHNGLRDLLITFRQAGRYLNVPENDLGGLISSAHSLSRPITILILGDDASGKSTFINNFFSFLLFDFVNNFHYLIALLEMVINSIVF